MTECQITFSQRRIIGHAPRVNQTVSKWFNFDQMIMDFFSKSHYYTLLFLPFAHYVHLKYSAFSQWVMQVSWGVLIIPAQAWEDSKCCSLKYSYCTVKGVSWELILTYPVNISCERKPEQPGKTSSSIALTDSPHKYHWSTV